jgi:hypothetical protein
VIDAFLALQQNADDRKNNNKYLVWKVILRLFDKFKELFPEIFVVIF